MALANPEITQLLKDWVDGDRSSLDALTPLVYDQLHRIAARVFNSERAGHTLQTTALVHEAYARLVDSDIDWQNRSHFFALAARLMRRILVDHARSANAERRGGGRQPVALEDVVVVSPQTGDSVLDLHDALTELADLDARKAEIMELHYFGGLTYEEMAEVLGISTSTLDREMRFAKAWIRTRLEP